MLLEEKIKTSEEVKKLVKKYGRSKSSILTILKAIQIYKLGLFSKS